MHPVTDPRDMQAPSGLHDERSLEPEDLGSDPIAAFRSWLADAEAAGVPLPNAMALATAGADGHPSVRHVLLRGVDGHGFVFFTNRESRKGRQLAENAACALVFLWKELDRQVSVTGHAEPLDDAASDAYFGTRSRDARIGAWASPQSATIGDRAELDRRVAEADARFPGEVPRPPHWGGYLVRPETIEFWQGRRHRLHDRVRFGRDEAARSGWRVERLAP
jgi:pyridoxamine 5'-phosphate oxidase